MDEEGQEPAGVTTGRRRRAFIDEPDPPPAPEEDEYDIIRPGWSRGRRVVVVVLAVAAIGVLFSSAVLFWAYRQLNPSGAAGEEVIVDVPSGSSTNAISDILEDRGVITNATVFRLYVSWRDKGPFLAGRYRLQRNSDADDVIRALEAGPLPPPSQRFTVPPGLNLRQLPGQVVAQIPSFSAETITNLIAANQIRSTFQPPEAGLEGFLFPDTYEIAEGADEAAVLQTMVAQFDRVAQEVGLGASSELVGYSPYDVLIVASMIEEEAKVDADRPKIARVIYNRLAAGEPLGVDATLCYEKEGSPCELRQSDLQSDSPYNTRRFVGLPPTPIANVGRASLDAALHPEEGPWFYYVLDPAVDPAGNTHFFTDSAAEFEEAKARCRAAGLGCG